MRDVVDEGMRVARHLRGEIYEVRADAAEISYRVLFASIGAKGRILLSLVAFKKQTQRTPRSVIELAERRLADWQIRGAKARRIP